MTDKWRTALRRPTKDDSYNVRVITRGRDGMYVQIDLTEVPKELWIKHFGTRMLSNLLDEVDGAATEATEELPS